MRLLLLLFISVCLSCSPAGNQGLQVDICVYGGTSAGVMAAYSAAKLGKSVVLIEPGRHLGGLTSGGLGYTDIGNKYAVTALALDYYRRLGKHYGTFEQWIFEPHVAENLFKEYIQRGKVQVLYDHRLKSAEKNDQSITRIVLERSRADALGEPVEAVFARMFIDATYEGDLMAKAGVRYTIGREDNSQYGETWNGVQLLDKHQFPDDIDPFIVPGDPGSGLVWGISSDTLDPAGTGDKRVQAYNFRICLTDDPTNQVPITRPPDYDASRYELLLRYFAASPPTSLWSCLKFDKMPNHKTDINNNGPFSTDMIGMNYDYPEADYETRAAVQLKHQYYNQGLLFFLTQDVRVPAVVREALQKWGYPKDEYTDNDHWSWQMYVREARRMVGEYVMTQAHCEGREVVPDPIALAAYTMDSHNCNRLVITKDGRKMVKNEGDVQKGGFPPYPISYRSLTPKSGECSNLLVPVCLSASHIAFGSIRMEPVFMVLGQVSAIAAAMAIDGNIPVQKVDAGAIKSLMERNPLLDGSVPDVIVDNEAPACKVISGNWEQKTGARGNYNRSLLQIDPKAGSGSVSFEAALTQPGSYEIYAYVPKLEGGSNILEYQLFNGTAIQTATLDLKQLEVAGQASGTWISIGKMDWSGPSPATVTVNTTGADGLVVADAVQWVFR